MKELPLPRNSPTPLPDDPLLAELGHIPSAVLPNAFLVGAMKSGTSWLAKQLELHPDIFVPGIKEPNLLMQPVGAGSGFGLKGPLPEADLYHRMHRFSAATAGDYQAMYAAAPEGVAFRLDASVRYLVSDLAADRLAQIHTARKIPPRILIMLRDPVERTWSHWQMHRSMGIEPLGFEAALDAEAERLRDGWSEDWAYAGYSRYDRHLPRYLDRLGRENIHVEFFEEVMADREAALARVFGFLDLDPARADSGAQDRRVRGKKSTGSSGIEQISEYYRPGWRKAVPKPVRHAIRSLLDTLNSRAGQREMPERLRARLRREFFPVIRGVETLSGRTPPWPTGEAR